MFPPTFGDIYVQGDSIAEVSYEIQERTGICNQVRLGGGTDREFDYFWPGFTPKQMFNVIGSFKGGSAAAC